MQKHVVILGAGFAGIRTAIELSRHSYGDLKITLIDKREYHIYTPDLYEAASAFLPENPNLGFIQFISLHLSTSIPIKEIFKKYKNVNVIIDEVENVEFGENRVETKSGDVYSYDWLVVALGSETNFFNISGLKEKAYTLKNTEDALNIRNTIDELFLKKAKHESISIVIGGGGYAGCELAAELAGYVKKLAKHHSHPRGNIKITIAEAERCLFPGTNKWIQNKSAKRFEKLGVHVLTKSPISGFQDGKIFIDNEKRGKQELACDIFIWTAGVKANHLAEKITDVKKEKGGCLVADQYLNISPQKNVFVAGDMSYCFDSRLGAPLPMTAQIAVHQAKYVAYTIKRLLHKRKPFPYIPHKNKFIVPLGGRYALADLGMIKISGWPAWILRRLVSLKYFWSILPPHKAIMLWLVSSKIYLAND